MKPLASSTDHTWRPLALLLLASAAAVAVFTRLIPYELRPFNFALAGALFLYAGARLRPWAYLFLPFVVMIAVDLYFMGIKHWEASPWVYGSYAVYLLLAAGFLRRSESPLRIGAVVLVGSIQFFLITNFGVWLGYVLHPELSIGTPYYCPPTFAGLMQCYELGIPFFRGTLLADVLFSGALFGAHAWLARAYFPAERVIPASPTEPLDPTTEILE